jgi:hypothetical protein
MDEIIKTTDCFVKVNLMIGCLNVVLHGVLSSKVHSFVNRQGT